MWSLENFISNTTSKNQNYQLCQKLEKYSFRFCIKYNDYLIVQKFKIFHININNHEMLNNLNKSILSEKKIISDKLSSMKNFYNSLSTNSVSDFDLKNWVLFLNI